MSRVILRATYRQIKIVILLLQSGGSAQSLGAKGLGFRAYGVGLGFGVKGVGIRV